jgi:2-dehydro-3-deoxyphosphooctonate aldolase (KDO 8-P synthase)
MNLNTPVETLVNPRNNQPLVIIAGVNVLEDLTHTETVLASLSKLTTAMGMPFIFKASFDKANRSDHRSYRGPGFSEGLSQLKHLKSTFKVPVITDVHEVSQVEAVADVVDVLQIPAFLSRQTDLLGAAAATSLPILLKKMQMMSPADAMQARSKCLALGACDVIICERGTSFGYQNLVLDLQGLCLMKRAAVPLVVDISHSLQQPGALGRATGGRGIDLFEMARAVVALGIGGLFFECHVEPSAALCDGPCALPLKDLEGFLPQVQRLDALVKSSSF